MKSRFIDLTGLRFGMLVVKHWNHKDSTGQSWWSCKCDCGGDKIIRGYSLRRGDSKSCGCGQRKPKFFLPSGRAAFNNYLYRTKKNAKIRGLCWELTEQQFEEITSKECFYCGSSPKREQGYGRYNGSYVSNGIDRVDNGVGYILGNCVTCCKECNYAKNTMSMNEFKEFIKSIYIHWAKS